MYSCIRFFKFLFKTSCLFQFFKSSMFHDTRLLFPAGWSCCSMDISVAVDERIRLHDINYTLNYLLYFLTLFGFTQWDISSTLINCLFLITSVYLRFFYFGLKRSRIIFSILYVVVQKLFLWLCADLLPDAFRHVAHSSHQNQPR